MKKFSVEIKKFNNDVIATSAVACANESYDHYKITSISSTPIDENTQFDYEIYRNKQFEGSASTYGRLFTENYTSANVGDWYYFDGASAPKKCTGDHSDYAHN